MLSIPLLFWHFWKLLSCRRLTWSAWWSSCFAPCTPRRRWCAKGPPPTRRARGAASPSRRRFLLLSGERRKELSGGAKASEEEVKNTMPSRLPGAGATQLANVLDEWWRLVCAWLGRAGLLLGWRRARGWRRAGWWLPNQLWKWRQGSIGRCMAMGYGPNRVATEAWLVARACLSVCYRSWIGSGRWLVRLFVGGSFWYGQSSVP
jgi:hypothetical protein